ncbi:hypothetical protein [Thermus sediminis]|uniref:hypothetical protein n=1 Tax=Thermus sediminis TaxID=1761908 RepID=UPI000E3E5DE4|nr:hypothetical protein [Thermus sediminis]
MRKWLFLFPLALAACTGSQEPPLPALLAAGGEGEVRFYRASDLQRGLASPVATWATPGLQDLAYLGREERLYLLFGDRLEAYDAAGFTESAVPQTLLASAYLPDCTGGYLRLGQNRLLVHCPGAEKAFLLPPDLGSLEEADLTGLEAPLRLALLPRGTLDLLAYMTPGALGFRPAQDPRGTPGLERFLDPPLAQGPFDLKADGSRGRLLGLGATLSETRIYALQGESLTGRRVLGDFPRPARLALDPVAGLAVLGQGFQVLEPRDSGLQEAFRTFSAGLVGVDAYLYLVAGNTLQVWDLFPSPPQRVASPLLGFSPKALAFLPVE